MSGVKGKSGMKPYKFDLVAVEGLGGLDCTYEELASFPMAICPKCKGGKEVSECNCEEGKITVSKILIEKLMMNHDSDFCKAYKKGNGNKKISLRRQMYQAASEGNTALLIFLAKNRLGMTDYQVHVQVDVKQLIAQCDISEAEFNRVKGRIDRGELDFGETKLIEGKEDEKEDG